MKAREKAYNGLCDIILGNQYSNLYLRKELDDFSAADKAFITNIIYGTMQNYLYLRYQWIHYVDVSISKDMALLMDMSIYQFLFMDKVPDYAIVNEAVEIAATMHKGKYRTMINAMLRRFLREGKKEVIGNEETQLSIMTSHPLWVIKMWSKQYGFEITKKICEADKGVATSYARVNTLVSNRQQIIENNELFELGEGEDALIYKGGNIANTKEYLTGLLTIQDASSQKVAHWLNAQPNESVLDTCAAPGTKTTHIAQMMNNQGEIVALDLHEHRVELIKHSAARLGITIIKPICKDATELAEYYDGFDKVLVDAPCSGYGVMRRKNDIKVHMLPSDMDELIPLQKAILNEASQCVKENGILVYSTCTLNKKENEKQIENFLADHPHFECLEMQTLFPFEKDQDGFFIAKLKRLVF